MDEQGGVLDLDSLERGVCLVRGWSISGLIGYCESPWLRALLVSVDEELVITIT